MSKTFIKLIGVNKGKDLPPTHYVKEFHSYREGIDATKSCGAARAQISVMLLCITLHLCVAAGKVHLCLASHGLRRSRECYMEVYADVSIKKITITS